MLREEAEREAERRNLEDPERVRYEFYAFDESAGMAQDAWDIGRRLRRGRPPSAERTALRPQTPAAGAPPPEPAPKPKEPPEPEPEEPEEPPEPEPEEPDEPAHRAGQSPGEPIVVGGPTLAETDPFSGPDPFAEPLPYEEPGPPEWAEEEPERERRSRGTVFVQVFGAIVIVVAMLWMALIVYLAVVLKPNSTTSLGVFVGGVVLGLLAILIGVTIRRS